MNEDGNNGIQKEVINLNSRASILETKLIYVESALSENKDALQRIEINIEKIVNKIEGICITNVEISTKQRVMWVSLATLLTALVGLSLKVIVGS